MTPTILELAKNNNLYLLCISTGDVVGLGSLRRIELEKSADYLGFKDIEVFDHP